jgi:zinc transporter 7
VGLVVGSSLPETRPLLEAFTAGGFIFISTVDVLPLLLTDSDFWQTVKETLAMSVGVALMVGVAYIEDGTIDVSWMITQSSSSG